MEIIYPNNSNIIDIISSLPGIYNVTSNISFYGHEPLMIYFNVYGTDRGLFFLTRCSDRRYCEYGHEWKIELSVGDTFKDGNFPICYMFNSGNIKGNDTEPLIINLIKNMNIHLNNDNFLNGYNLDREDFKSRYIVQQRKMIIKKVKDKICLKKTML